MHLAFRVHPACKTMYICAGWSASLYTALVSKVMRTCKGASVQVDHSVYFLFHPPPPEGGKWEPGAAYV